MKHHKWKLIKPDYWQCIHCKMDRERHLIGIFPRMIYMKGKNTINHAPECNRKEASLKLELK